MTSANEKNSERQTLNCWSRFPRALGCSLELDDKTLLFRTSHTSVTGHREIKQDLGWSFIPVGPGCHTTDYRQDVTLVQPWPQSVIEAADCFLSVFLFVLSVFAS